MGPVLFAPMDSLQLKVENKLAIFHFLDFNFI